MTSLSVSAQESMQEQMTALTSLLEEGLVTQDKYDVLVVQIMSGKGIPDFQADDEDERTQEKEQEQEFSYEHEYEYGEDEEEGEDYDYDDRSMCSRSSSLFLKGQGEWQSDQELSSDEDDINLHVQQAAVSSGASLGFSALYKQHSLVDILQNPANSSSSSDLPPPPPSDAPASPSNTVPARQPMKQALNKNLTMVGGGGRPKTPKKKALDPSPTKPMGGNRRGFFRQTSSFEAAKFNTSLAASLKKNQFEIIMIDGRDFPPPSCAPPPAGDIPPPPPAPEDSAAAAATTSSGVKEGEDDRPSSSSAPRSSTDQESYKQKQFAMRPELLSAALKKRSQWALNRHNSSEFYN